MRSSCRISLAIEIVMRHRVPQISIIVPTRNNQALLQRMLEGVANSLWDCDRSAELIVVDNASDSRETVNYLRQLPDDPGCRGFTRIQVLNYSWTFNYSKINNRAEQAASGEYLCFMNDDVEVIHHDWLDEMCHQLDDDAVGVVGAMLYFPDDTIQHAGIALGFERVAGHPFKRCLRSCHGPHGLFRRVREVSAVTGACMLVRRVVFDRLSGFDPGLAVAYNDVDFCLRARWAGYRILWTPHAKLYHHESSSRRRSPYRTKLQRFRHWREVRYMERKWGQLLQRDPFMQGIEPRRKAACDICEAAIACKGRSRLRSDHLSSTSAMPVEAHHRSDDANDATALSVRPTVAIVLCSRNGARYIDRQLESLFNQSWPVSIYVFDDASSDDTPARVRELNAASDLVLVNRAQGLGFVRNFEDGMATVLAQGFDYLALADQDDVWHPERIERGMRRLLAEESDSGDTTALLVHSDLEMIDEHGRQLHPSYLDYRGYDVGEQRNLPRILGQNGVMGNTVLINRAMIELALPFPAGLHSHDYWLALMAELFGKRLYIEETLVSYRIHDSNASNRRGKMRFGVLRHVNGVSWSRLRQRDFRLPYKEDSRLVVLDSLLSGELRHPPLSEDQQRIIAEFTSYLRFEKHRMSLLGMMLRLPFLKRNCFHRIRFALCLLTTRRYRVARRGRATPNSPL